VNERLMTASFLDFAGRWVVVTGASSGLGRAIAIELARHGARLVMIGRDEAKLSETRQALEGSGHRQLVLDLAQHGAIAPAVEAVRQETGPLYGLCHAAGVVTTRPLQATKVDVLQAQLDINLLAGIELARAVCRRDVMTEGAGSVVFISSVYGQVGMPGQIGYCASKGALVAAARAMAIELARRHVRVNCVSPGLVFTAMTEKAFSLLSQDQVEKIKSAYPLGPGRPEDVARAVVFLLSPGTPWITGVDLPVDGGFTAQ
jgi:NAD(P)-dependent dehydrogenase (short-subunit alcohol dehydrogenase family)